VELLLADSPARIAAARELFLEYAASLPVDLAYQDFEREVAELPGEYAAPSGTLRIAIAWGFGGPQGPPPEMRRFGGPQGPSPETARPLGCVAVRALEPGCCEMKRLYVRAEARGLGLGRTLAESAIAFARRRGYSAMRLDTMPTMSVARELYRGLGFREIPAYRFSPVPGNVYLELTLAPRADPSDSGRP
jgi:putative acetyltransferase